MTANYYREECKKWRRVLDNVGGCAVEDDAFPEEVEILKGK